MRLVILMAFLVGGATMFGAAVGFFCKGASHRFADLTMSAAAGVMLASSVVGLLLPAMDTGGRFGLFVLFGGVALACGSMAFFERLTPRLGARLGAAQGSHSALLFVLVIAVHNFPEGLAAGVGYGTEQTARATAVAVGIALQNLPEGMVTVAPLLAAGFSPARALLFGLFTGAVEIFGTLLGYFAVHFCAALLPFSLALAGGCMLYVIFREMLPTADSPKQGRSAVFALLTGFCVMLAMDHLLS